MNISKNYLVLLLTVSGVSLGACSADSKQTAVVDTRPTVNVSPDFVIEQVDVQVSDSFPVQVTVLISGQLADDCKTPAYDIEEITGPVFTINMIESATAVPNCRHSRATFTHTVPLAVDGLKAGIYTINVNGVVKNFELTVDNKVRW